MANHITQKTEVNTSECKRLRCMPGDLAIISKGGSERLLGLFVRVVEPGDNGYDWRAEFIGEPLVGHDVYSGVLSSCQDLLVNDWNLTPIRGQLMEFSESAAEVCHV
ncbi:hypothetical protein WCQ02_30940 [Paraburkholderia tropica]|uniref:hypothetical protein n=1 Tax=Paraburkholderia tropica TaxID=92647 RepID=UPI003016654A